MRRNGFIEKYLRKHLLVLPILLGVLFLSAYFQEAKAMPMFARKLGVECTTCHTVIPRLNETGFKFREAGYRMPEEIGKSQEKKFDVADYFSGRIQARYDAKRTKIGSRSTVTNQVSFHELTLYPATGAWGKYLSSLVELSIAPEDFAEVENGYIRANGGNEKRFFQGRIGIFHPFEGFGASDRPGAISRPFFQTNAANFNQTTFFTPWGFDEAGVEAGLDYARTSLRATLFNGIVVREEDGAFKAFPAQGGELSKTASTLAHNTPDFQIFFNQILANYAGGVSVYYYHGNIALPVAGSEDFFRNNYDRVALYGSYPLAKQALVLAAFQHGRDHLTSGKTFESRGFFGEVDFPLSEYATPGIRYDWFDPSTDKSKNELRGITAFVNIPLNNGLQFITEYQHKNTKRGTAPDRTDDAFQIRFIFIL